MLGKHSTSDLHPNLTSYSKDNFLSRNEHEHPCKHPTMSTSPLYSPAQLHAKETELYPQHQRMNK